MPRKSTKKNEKEDRNKNREMENRLIDILEIESREDLVEKASKAAKEYGISVNESTDLYAFFGDPAGHSLSPRMYNTSFKDLGINSFYFASQIPEGKIRRAMEQVRRYGIKGVNISMPHKQAVMDELDEVDDLALLCEAVNTVVMDGDSNGLPTLTGYNTDALGAVNSIKKMGLNLEGAETVILGLGGAGKAVLVGLAKEGVRHITVFLRSINWIGHSQFATKICNAFPGLQIQICSLKDRKALKNQISDVQLLINCTNVGMGSLEGKSLIPDSSYLHKDLCVMDIIYSPSETKLLAQGKEAGCKATCNGLGMLLGQGEEAFRLYTGKDVNLTLDIE